MIMDFPFSVDIVRTARRKSAEIEINGETVRVLVPNTLSDQRIHDLINKRSVWIKQKLSAHASTPEPKPREYVNGETFPYLGRNYRLKLVISKEYSVKLKNGYLTVAYPKTDNDQKNHAIIKRLLTTWYQSHAYDRLHEKTKRYSKIIGVNPKGIKIDDFKARWGSCLDTGEVAYNWRIILASHQIVDYIVIHELCHLIEHNHSPKYWKLVETYCEDYHNCRKWLKDNGANLKI